MVRKVSYFYTSIKDESGAGFQFLSRLAARNVDLIAVTAVPFGPDRAQLTLFPAQAERLLEAARLEGMELDGPHAAIQVHGHDQVGAFAGVLEKLAAASINVFSVQGITDGRGGFGYLVYLRPSDVDRAFGVLAERT